MGLEASASFDAQDWSRTTGAHIAIVDVDAETGNTTLLRYIAVDDVGQVLDQDGVRAMLEGGIAHGIGQIMMEKVAYDENGQLLTPSLMDYALPRIDGRPVYDVRPLESRGTTAEARSAGNAGAIASPAAVANAVLDALAPLGVTHIDPPLTPSRIWEVIRSARGEVD
jgi:carbon-monoxide dehydrogenase large subunit